MASLSRAVLATALAGTGLLATSGAAFAGDNHDGPKGHDDATTQKGIVNVDDTQTTTPLQACNNNVPTNVGGVQVPIQDLAADIPILSSSDEDGEGSGSGVDKGCAQGTDTVT